MSKVIKELNPFLEGKPIRVVQNIERYQEVNLKGKRREVTDYFESDYHDCTKVYFDSEVYPKLYDLSPRAIKLLMYVIRHLPRGKDYMELAKKKVCKEINIKESGFNTVKNQLVNAKILVNRKARSNTYWINPHFLFKGRRPDSIRKIYGEDFVDIQTKKEYYSK